MRKRTRQRPTGRHSRRLVLESLETRELLTAVTEVRVPELPVESLEIVFSESMDMDASSVSTAVSLHNFTQGPVDLASSSHTYDDPERTLTWSIGTALPKGMYELRLDGAQLLSSSGEPLDGGTGGIRFQLPVFAAAQNVQANGSDIHVDSFSVPSLADWNADGLLDLILGQKTSDGEGKVGVHINVGTAESPEYGDAFFAPQEGADLAVVSQGCLGVYPRVFDWDGDTKKDLILGLADGRIQIFANVGSDADPNFGAPTDIMVGVAGEKTAIDVGARATFDIVDWNNDGRYDLVAAGFDGRVRVYANAADAGPAEFPTEVFVQEGDHDLAVPEFRASVDVADLDGDGRKDLVLGDTAGQVLFYRNIGTDAVPRFNGFDPILADGQAIDLPETPRSRPFVGDYNADGILDLLLGSQDGLVRFYEGLTWETPTTTPGPGGSPGGEYVFTFDVPAPPWQNLTNRLDVNNDTEVSPIDVLQIVNELNLREHINENGLLPATPTSEIPPPYLDVNGDGYCAPGDALHVINFLNEESPGGEGEATGHPFSIVHESSDEASEADREQAEPAIADYPEASAVPPARQPLNALPGPQVAATKATLDQVISDLAADIAGIWQSI